MARFKVRKSPGGAASYGVLRRCRFETLEPRLVLTKFYDFSLIAQTGGTFTDLASSASINDAGDIAFVATQAAGQAVYVGDGVAPATLVSFTPSSTRTYGSEIQLNNSRKVAAIDLVSSGSQRLARIWDANAPGTFTTIGRSSTPRLDSSHFDGLGNFTSLSNDGQLAFGGLENPTSGSAFWEVQLSNSFVDRRDVLSPFSEVAEYALPPSPFFRFQAADGDRVVIANRQGGPTKITVYDITGIDSSREIASTAAGLWANLGIRPAITDDGKVINFYGELTSAGAAAINAQQPSLAALASGAGIFTAFESNGRWIIRRIAGVAGNGVLDPNEDFQDTNSNGVFDPGTDIEIGVTSFFADSRASISRSTTSLYFTAWLGTDSETGLKTIYSTDTTTSLKNGALATITPSKASHVVAAGDTISGLGIVTDVDVNDSINRSGQVAFWASSGGSRAIVRAEPGLPDVAVVVTHGLGNTWNTPFGAVTPFSGFLDNWYGLAKRFEDLPLPGSKLDNNIGSYVSQWNSSDGWFEAAFSIIMSDLLKAGGNTAGSAIAGIVAETQLVRSAHNAELAAEQIVSDVRANLLGDPSLTQSGEQVIELVGHSRGAAVNARVAQLLVQSGYKVQEYIALDGYSTDWPLPSDSLADFDIQGIISSLGSNVVTKRNYLVQDGLELVLFDAIVAGLHIDPSIITPQTRDFITNELIGWKAPTRAALSNQLIVGMNERSNHLNVTDIYLNDKGAQPYLLDSYVGLNRSAPAPGLAVGTANSVGSGNLLFDALPTGVTDGDFSFSQSVVQSVGTSGLGTNSDPLVQAWAQLIADPEFAIGLQWDITGQVSLETGGGNPRARMAESTGSTLGQVISFSTNVTSVDFDVSVLGSEAGDTLKVLLDGNEITSVDIGALGAAAHVSVPLPGGYPSQGALTFALNRSGADTAIIDIDNIVLQRPGQPGDFNGNDAVDAADYVVWRKQNGHSDSALPNDGGLGVPIRQAHYDLWRQKFGGTLALSAGSSGKAAALTAVAPVADPPAQEGFSDIRLTGRAWFQAAPPVMSLYDSGSLNNGHVDVKSRTESLAAPGRVAANSEEALLAWLDSQADWAEQATADSGRDSGCDTGMQAAAADRALMQLELELSPCAPDSTSYRSSAR